MLVPDVQINAGIVRDLVSACAKHCPGVSALKARCKLAVASADRVRLLACAASQKRVQRNTHLIEHLSDSVGVCTRRTAWAQGEHRQQPMAEPPHPTSVHAPAHTTAAACRPS